MTLPGQAQPDDTITVGSQYTQDVTEANVQQMAKGGFETEFTGIGNGFLGFFAGLLNTILQTVNDIVDAFFGNYHGDDLKLINYQDGQRALNHRLDLLDNVSGYCNLTTGGTSQITGHWADYRGHPLLFYRQVGPSKAARHWYGSWSTDPDIRYTYADGIMFEQAGTWRIDTMFITQGVFTVGGWSKLEAKIMVIDVTSPGKPVFSEKVYYNECVEFHRTHQMAHTVVIPEGNKYVAFVTVKHNRGGAVKFPHGDAYTFFSVNRWDLDLDFPNPPAGGSLPDSA